MMTVGERQVNLPSAVHLAMHRMGRGMPVVEIASNENFLRFRCPAYKVHRFGHFLGGIAVPVGVAVGVGLGLPVRMTVGVQTVNVSDRILEYDFHL